MKRKIALLLVCIFAVTASFAQEQSERENYKINKKYRNFGYVNTSMSHDEMEELDSKFGASLTIGRTFFLNKKPILRLVRLGIDVTWFDLSYANYEIESSDDKDTETLQFHQAEIAMQIGPSITLSPFKRLNIHGYFRIAPSYSCLYADETLYSNYATFFVGGASISYGVIGFGIESRFGDCKYNKEFSMDIFDDNSSSTRKTKYSGWRAYLTFRF